MTRCVALLRAVNLGAARTLPMADLTALAKGCGFENVRTYIASGNLLLTSELGEAAVKKTLEGALQDYAGRAIPVCVRTAAEIAAVAAANPFPRGPGNRVVAIFLDDAPPPGALDAVTGLNGELLALGRREIYVYYGDGMRDTKLRIPAAKSGTARNLNTVTKLAALAAD